MSYFYARLHFLCFYPTSALWKGMSLDLAFASHPPPRKEFFYTEIAGPLPFPLGD